VCDRLFRKFAPIDVTQDHTEQRRKMKLTNSLSKLIFAAALPAVSVAGPSCGSTVSGAIVLDADLNCTNSDGLIVGADDTTIDLNGHNISCSGAGYLGSCQGLNRWGVMVWEKKNVTIKGPGKISGFTVGVWLQKTVGANARDLEVTGPASPGYGNNPRVDSAGILLQGAACPVDNATTANIQGNKVSNHRLGIFLLYSGCANVGHNYASDNNSDTWMNSYGIIAGQVSNTTIEANIVERNGDNLSTVEGGIGLGGADAKNNVITNNVSSNNCGDGIQLGVASSGNNVVTNNVMRNNGKSALNGMCKPPAAGVFFDLAERYGATGNKINSNNKCETQFGTMPSGICNPGE
jgi:parallel beta-helix repeat protein